MNPSTIFLQDWLGISLSEPKNLIIILLLVASVVYYISRSNKVPPPQEYPALVKNVEPESKSIKIEDDGDRRIFCSSCGREFSRKDGYAQPNERGEIIQFLCNRCKKRQEREKKRIELR